jgi:hypothetical protein
VDPLVRAKAAEAYLKTKDLVIASQLLRSWTKTDRILFEKIAEPLLDAACYDAVRAVIRAQRGKLGIYTEPSVSASGLVAMGGSNAVSLYDWYLPVANKLLRHAKREDVREARLFYLKQAAGNGRAAARLALIEKRLARHPGKTVEEVIPLPQLRTLWKKAA